MTSDRLPEPQALDSQLTAAERASATPGSAREKPAAPPPAPPLAAAPQSLPELQHWLVSAICEAGEPASQGIVSDGPRLSGRQCLEIYRDAYIARLSECLRDDYSALAATLGDDRFSELCQRYITAYPSRSPSLNAFGRHMADLCLSQADLLDAPAFYADLARLEWALVEVTHAYTGAPLALQVLQTIPAAAWGDARLLGSQALRLLTFEYPVNAHYQAYRRDGVVLPLPAAEACATAVYRRELMLWRMDLTPAMTRVLSALLAGSTIGQALERIHVPDLDRAAQAEAERSVMTWFQAWMSSGFFTELIAP
ncbi:MAG TPA: DNA-binding domain-containing protein [Polyangiales bacterium]|nr:DNA-binding domain-containing protein [Polyangiales bacterium]